MAPSLKPKILLPLYIFPDPGKWKPLFNAIINNPIIEFLIIINPNSGPGAEPWWPNMDYVREVPRLNALPNVRTVGYVYTAYCKRPIDEVISDIAKYAKWSMNQTFSGLGVSGVFFDETPNVYTENVMWYLDTITEKVKNMEGILGDRTVIHNPGTAVDSRLANPGPDITTIAEVAYADFITSEYKGWLSTSLVKRQVSYMIHSVPLDDVEELVRSVRKDADFIFVTDLTAGFYSKFGKSWEVFVAVMAEDGEVGGVEY